MEELPTQTCDRVPNTFYIYKQQTRFWNGKRLLCEHKKQPCTCPTCNPQGAERHRQQVRERDQNNRCEHEKRPSRCPTCNPKGAERNRQRSRERQRNNRCEHKKQPSTCPTCNPEGAERNLQRYREREQNNPEVRQRNRERALNWRRTSEKNRCNDGCICFLHSEEPRFKYRNKFGYEDGSVRVCYECAMVDIRQTKELELKQQKKDYYNIHATKTDYLFRIEYAILCHLNDYSLIDQMNQEELNIHDKDIVSIVGKNTTNEKRPDRAYLINNNLLLFEIDETGVRHEKSIERLLHIKKRLEEKFTDGRVINLHVFRFNINDQEENSMVERREFLSGFEQKEVGYVLSEHGRDIIECDFLPQLERVYKDCQNMKDIKNDKQLTIYELNACNDSTPETLEDMIDKYVQDNQNETCIDYVSFL